MKAEEATRGKQTVLQRRKVGNSLFGKFLPAGLQPGQQTGLPQVSANEQNNIKLSKTSDREQREKRDGWKESIRTVAGPGEEGRAFSIGQSLPKTGQRTRKFMSHPAGQAW